MEARPITDEMVEQFKSLWEKEGKGKLSVTKARKRLEKAVEHGCLMCDECAKCPKVRECPVLNLDNVEL